MIWVRRGGSGAADTSHCHLSLASQLCVGGGSGTAALRQRPGLSCGLALDTAVWTLCVPLIPRPMTQTWPAHTFSAHWQACHAVDFKAPGSGPGAQGARSRVPFLRAERWGPYPRCIAPNFFTTMSRDGGWDLVKGVRTSGPSHCQPYQCCNFTHSSLTSTTRCQMTLKTRTQPASHLIHPPGLSPLPTAAVTTAQRRRPHQAPRAHGCCCDDHRAAPPPPPPGATRTRLLLLPRRPSRSAAAATSRRRTPPHRHPQQRQPSSASTQRAPRRRQALQGRQEEGRIRPG